MINKKAVSLILIIGKIWSFYLWSMKEVIKEEKNNKPKQETQYHPSTSDRKRLKDYIVSLNTNLEQEIKSSSTDMPSQWINYLLKYICGPAVFCKYVIQNKKNQHTGTLPFEIVDMIVPCVALQEKFIYQQSSSAQTLASRIAHACDSNSHLIGTLNQLPLFMIKDIHKKMARYIKLLFDKPLAQNYRVNTLTIHNNDKMITFGSQTQLCVWDIKKDTLNKMIFTPCSITTIACNREKIAAGCMNGSINIWNLENNYQYTLSGKDPIDAVAFDAKGDTLISRTDTGVTIWNLSQQASLNIKEFNIHKYACFSADGSILASPYIGGIGIWDLNKKEQIQAIDIGWYLLALSPNGHNLLAMSRDSKAFIYNITEKQIIPLACKEKVITATFCCNDAMITTSSQEGTLYLWNAKTGTLITSLPHQKIMKEITGGHCKKMVACVTQEGAILLYCIHHDKKEMEKSIVNTIKRS